MAGFTKFLNFSRLGAYSLARLILKHWYMFILILVLIPTIISSIGLGIQERNPAIPFIDLGLVLANADAQIADDVETLKTNPQELIGMEKPTAGIWSGIKYKWAILKVILKELGLIWAIFFPFVVIYKILRHRNISETAKNVTWTMIYGALLIIFVNMTMIIHGLVTETLTSTVVGNTDMYKVTGMIILQSLPFHGLLNLAVYLVSLLG